MLLSFRKTVGPDDKADLQTPAAVGGEESLECGYEVMKVGAALVTDDGGRGVHRQGRGRQRVGTGHWR